MRTPTAIVPRGSVHVHPAGLRYHVLTQVDHRRPAKTVALRNIPFETSHCDIERSAVHDSPSEIDARKLLAGAKRVYFINSVV